MAFRRKHPAYRRVISVPMAAVTITNGDLVKKNGTSNNVTNNVASGDTPLGIAVETKASGQATIKIDILAPGDWVIADIGSGAAASGDFKSCDIRNAASKCIDLAAGTDTNHDCLYMYNGTTTTADVMFQKLQVVNAN